MLCQSSTVAAYSWTETTQGALRGDSEMVDNNSEEHGEEKQKKQKNKNGMNYLKRLLL